MANLDSQRRRDHGRMMRQVSQAVVMINGKVDMDEIGRRRNTTKRLYPFMNLPNTPSEAQFTAHNGNVAFVRRAGPVGGKDGDMMQRPTRWEGGMHDDQRVPASATLNGATGGNTFEVAAMYTPLGLVTEQNRNNGEDSFGIQTGGTTMYTNNSTEAHNVGDLICVLPPDPHNMSQYPSSSVDGDKIPKGEAGRAEWIFTRFDPALVNLVDGKLLASALAVPRADRSPIMREFIDNLIDALANVQYFVAQGAAGSIQNYLTARGKNDVKDADKEKVANELLTILRGPGGRHSTGFEDLVSSVIKYKLEMTRLVIGRAQTPAASGAGGVIQLGSYAI
jgi:hypothetical protein